MISEILGLCADMMYVDVCNVRVYYHQPITTNNYILEFVLCVAAADASFAIFSLSFPLIITFIIVLYLLSMNRLEIKPQLILITLIFGFLLLRFSAESIKPKYLAIFCLERSGSTWYGT